MLAEKSNTFKETCETVYKLNQNDSVRYWCEMREEGHRILRTYDSLLKESEEKLAEKDAQLAENAAKLAEKEEKLAEKEAQLAENATLIAELQAKLNAQNNHV